MRVVPSMSVMRQPSACAAYIGYGDMTIVVRLVPPGSTLDARSYSLADSDRASGYIAAAPCLAAPVEIERQGDEHQRDADERGHESVHQQRAQVYDRDRD